MNKLEADYTEAMKEAISVKSLALPMFMNSKFKPVGVFLFARMMELHVQNPEEEWICMPVDEVAKSMRIKRTAQTTGFKRMIDAGLIEQRISGHPPRRYFRFTPDCFEKLEPLAEEYEAECREYEEKMLKEYGEV